jgi:hypothetical protein
VTWNPANHGRALAFMSARLHVFFLLLRLKKNKFYRQISSSKIGLAPFAVCFLLPAPARIRPCPSLPSGR